MPYKDEVKQREYQKIWKRNKYIPHPRISQKGIVIPHWTVSGYDYHKCRCYLCLDAKTFKRKVG